VAGVSARRPLILLAILFVAWTSLQLKLDYIVLAPGPAVDVAAMIEVEGREPAPLDSLYLTTVYSDMDVNVLKLLNAQVAGDALILPKQTVLPPSMDVQEYIRLVGDMMDESKTVAKIAALQYLGHDVAAGGEGATVQQLMPGSTAEGVLRAGDVIVEVEGQAVRTATDLVNVIRRQRPGDTISLIGRRGAEEFAVGVATKESESEPGIAVIGAMVRTYMFGHNLPVHIEIDSQNIGGTSAGLMFALGIIDVMEEGSLTSGRRVAGTGTISLDGTVGPVGGVGQKVVGAERSGAEYFLVPRHNLIEAERAAQRLTVVPVDNLRDAVTYLKQLQGVAPSTSHLPSFLSYFPPPYPTRGA
jgi:Lon-like protease